MPKEERDALIEKLLRDRGYATAEEQERFLSPDFERDTFSPNLLVDIDRAVARVLRALETHEHIAIYSDFDCDGIPAAVIMHDFFHSIGHTHIEVYIPHRDEEGFGVHTRALDVLKGNGATLVITVDVGSSAHAALAYALEIGLDVIVTDHHEFDTDDRGEQKIPPAYAVINPKRKGIKDTIENRKNEEPHRYSENTYPFPDLCGSGVAFQFVRACLALGKETYALLAKPESDVMQNLRAYPPGKEKWLLDMVGIATVADMVPLVGENRALASFGLVVLRKSRRPGIAALCSVAKIDQAHITEDTIGYTIAPRINAASRMGDARIAFELFSTQDPVRAQACAEALEKLNNERKGLVGSITKSAHIKISERHNISELPRVMVLGDPSWKPSVLGSVASTLAEQYKRPFFLWGREGSGLLKGSCRSYGEVNVLAVLSCASHVLIQHGGHMKAGGFAVEEVHVHDLQETFASAYELHVRSEETAENVSEKKGTDLSESPVAIDLAHVTLPFIRALRSMAPFGVGNPEPVFRMQGIAKKIAQFGKEKNHFEMVVGSEQGSTPIRCISFFSNSDSFSKNPQEGSSVIVLGTLTESRFAGRVNAEVRIEDIQ